MTDATITIIINNYSNDLETYLQFHHQIPQLESGFLNKNFIWKIIRSYKIIFNYTAVKKQTAVNVYFKCESLPLFALAWSIKNYFYSNICVSCFWSAVPTVCRSIHTPVAFILTEYSRYFITNHASDATCGRSQFFNVQCRSESNPALKQLEEKRKNI